MNVNSLVQKFFQILHYVDLAPWLYVHMNLFCFVRLAFTESRIVNF
jgi:hypothetical protein